MRLIFCLFFLVGCGGEPSGDSYNPDPLPPPSLPLGFANAKVVIDEQCAVSGCHAGAVFTQNGAAFKASKSRQKIVSGSMPKKSGPNYAIYNSAKKKILLDYLSSK